MCGRGRRSIASTLPPGCRRLLAGLIIRRPVGSILTALRLFVAARRQRCLPTSWPLRRGGKIAVIWAVERAGAFIAPDDEPTDRDTHTKSERKMLLTTSTAMCYARAPADCCHGRSCDVASPS
ncbi:hypothetical protein Q1695_011452 [Nippostrongylus brasiliensis]|nr:hypothetical protein Q1695_011452 [Nippostrongylus brasiliensis]